ncbi:ethylene-responsive transcription factor ERF020-like [Populus alba x Populus x berolinensis]|uniref:Ethylene-responsive transcription factor ERF020-like n=1 Tax=Populus alba x Populus x berolinensis TaxID=444605 RepID=A0AAD6PP32_9ROSI|nr:ethylene-responsive transcription factor ERF020-like [Populus alba x Populus x berolinensis]
MSGSSGSSGGSRIVDQESGASAAQRKFKGTRRRKWGKWVSEIRIPGKQERLWLGSYSTPEAAAVAHDIASYCLRGPSSLESLNFPLMLPASVREDMSPKSIQKAASDAGMAIDAQMILNRSLQNEVNVGPENPAINHGLETQLWEPAAGGGDELARKQHRNDSRGRFKHLH